MPKERATYVTYNEGLEAKHLHLGNLVHDYKNPNELDPYVETAYVDIAEPPPAWARLIPLENYALTLGKGSIEDLDDENQTADAKDGSSAGQIYRVAAAAKTTKIEIKDPKKFFDEFTLSSNEAKKWLSARLLATESLTHFQGQSPPRPEIWMLTGLILMTHATWTCLSSTNEAFIAGLQAPFDPTGVSAIRRSSVSDGVRPTFGYTASDDVKHISGAVIHETGKYPGTRGWAAQWQRVDTEIVSAENGQDQAKNHLFLKGTPKLPPKTAVLELQEDVYAERDDPEDEFEDDFDGDYWEAFLDLSEEYE